MSLVRQAYSAREYRKWSVIQILQRVTYQQSGSSETTYHRTCFTRKARGNTSTGRIVYLRISPLLFGTHLVFSADRSRRSKRKPKIPASVSATYSSTVAEELLALMRKLHTLEAWNPLVNEFISAQLKSIVTMVTTVEPIEEEDSQVRCLNPVLA